MSPDKTIRPPPLTTGAPLAASLGPLPSERPPRRGPSKRGGLLVLALLVAPLTVYLFVSAPPPLPQQVSAGATITIARTFAILQAENHAARALWTIEIVEQGKKVGLRFDEAWRDKEVEAGPLPALFLRLTAQHLERHPTKVSLFLGSDFPINDVNRFSGTQLDSFRKIAETGQPQFFFDPATRRQVGMFADVAVSEACTTCHNNHQKSPKNDWRLQDVMGATTWMHPEANVTYEQSLKMIGALRSSIREAYATYIEKARTFTKRPEIGHRWPREGFFLPTVDVFCDELSRRTSSTTIRALTEKGTLPAGAAVE